MATRILKLNKTQVGRLGGLARVKTHGNPGTFEGRRKGGQMSQLTHHLLHTNFKIRKKIKPPLPSKEFSEFLGIMYGDGSNGNYQTAMTTSSITDVQHATYVAKLAENLFGLKVSLMHRPKHNTLVVVVNSADVCDILELNGLPKGNKVKNLIRIPNWVVRSRTYSLACLRGLFDTDGCVYIDRHTVKNKTYKNICLSFSNHNLQLLGFFYDTLIKAGLHPTLRKSHCVFLRKAKEIDIFFDIVGTSNHKHLKKYLVFKRLKDRKRRIVV